MPDKNLTGSAVILIRLNPVRRLDESPICAMIAAQIVPVYDNRRRATLVRGDRARLPRERRSESSPSADSPRKTEEAQIYFLLGFSSRLTANRALRNVRLYARTII